MAAETEITVQVLCNKNDLFRALEKKGFLLKRRLQITDYYYTHLDITDTQIAFPKLSKNSLIVRHKEIVDKSDLSTFGIDGVASLLYKRKEFDGDRVMSEMKISCELGDPPQKARRILAAAGLNHWCTKKGMWHIYKQRELELYVQEIEDLGLFIELEQPDPNSKKSAKSIMKSLIKELKALKIPIGDDFNINTAHMIYMKNSSIAAVGAKNKVKVSKDGKGGKVQKVVKARAVAAKGKKKK